MIRLDLENAVFEALDKKCSVTKPMAIKKDNFHAGAQAHDEGGYVVYDKKTGALYDDADGTGLQGPSPNCRLVEEPEADA